MARSDTEYLEELRLARDKITDSINLDGTCYVEVTIRGRTMVVTDPTVALERLAKLIAEAQRTVNDSSGKRIRPVSLRRAGNR